MHIHLDHWHVIRFLRYIGYKSNTEIHENTNIYVNWQQETENRCAQVISSLPDRDFLLQGFPSKSNLNMSDRRYDYFLLITIHILAVV